MIKKFEEFNEKIRWPFSHKKELNPNDPYGEENWETGGDETIMPRGFIRCDSCGEVIYPKEKLFLLFGKPIHNRVICLMDFSKKGRSIRNVSYTSYNKAKKILAKSGYFDKREPIEPVDYDELNDFEDNGAVNRDRGY